MSFNPTTINVLMTGAGAPGGPGIIKALQLAGYNLYVGDSNLIASGRFLNKQFIQLPEASNDNFIDFILAYCLQQQITVIFPLVTRELFKLAKEKNKFQEQGIIIIVSAYDSLCIANDKGKLYTHLFNHKIMVPDFHIVKSVPELKQAAAKLGYPAKAICVKPSVSNGSRGVRVLQTKVDEYDLLFHHKPNNLYSSLEKLEEILADKSFPELLVSEYLPGEEYTIDTLVVDGVPVLVLPRVRSKMNNGISVQGTFIKEETIIDYCVQIIRSLQLSGPIGLQVKKAEDGRFKLLEINPRIQGTSVAAMGMDINLPSLAIQTQLEAIDFSKLSIVWGTSFVRYYQEVFY